MLLCPLCHRKLQSRGRALSCEGGHCFDRAKSGYVNLLPAAKGVHGDDRRMVQARRAFLGAGYYAPLMETIAALCTAHLPADGTLLDCGCGEGSYSAEIFHALWKAGRRGEMIGVDISKDTVDYAARRMKAERMKIEAEIASSSDASGKAEEANPLPASEFAVASVFHLPIEDESADGIVNLFAPMADEEYARVLKAGGWVLKVAPLPHHLMELKSAIYDAPRPTDPEPDCWAGFTEVARGRVEFPIHLPTNEAIRALFTMTPYCYTTPEIGLKRLQALERLDVTAAFQWILHRKDGGDASIAGNTSIVGDASIAGNPANRIGASPNEGGGGKEPT